jgi:hypothetical protein
MLSWMLYSIVVSLLMGLAALALERSAQIRQRPARWLWGTCMVASLAILFIPSRVSVQIPETTHAEPGDIFRNTHAPANDSNRNVAVHVADHWHRSNPVI